MKCSSCSKPAVAGIALCSRCLVSSVERRAKRVLSKAGIARKSRVLVVNDKSCEGAVALFVAKKLIALPQLAVAASIPKKSRYGFIIVPCSADAVAESFLGFMLNNVKLPQGKHIELLKGSLSSELAAYARIKRIKYKQGRKSSDTAVLLERLESAYTGSKFGLAKSRERMK